MLRPSSTCKYVRAGQHLITTDLRSVAEVKRSGPLSDFPKHLPQQKKSDISCRTTAVPAIWTRETLCLPQVIVNKRHFRTSGACGKITPERGCPPLRPFSWTMLKYYTSIGRGHCEYNPLRLILRYKTLSAVAAACMHRSIEHSLQFGWIYYA